MIHPIIQTDGNVLGYRIGRLFVSTDRLFPSLRYGGCMVTHKGKRKVAVHLFWRISWVFE